MTEIDEIKLYMSGSFGVGKTSIIVQFIQNVFIPEYEPTMDDSYRKVFLVDNKRFLLDILDTPPVRPDVLSQILQKRNGVILVYAINDRSSFSELRGLVDQIRQVTDRDTFPILMVGNKTDLEGERTVDREEARALANMLCIGFTECCAKNSVDHVFQQIVQSVMKKQQGNKKNCNLM